jgi:hypothetical protein
MSRDNAETDRSSRLLVMWEHPRPLSLEEARAWASSQAGPLRGSGLVEHVKLLRLSPPSGSHAAQFGWLLELRPRAHTAAAELAQEEVLRDFLLDLRSLRLAPTILVADQTYGPRGAG